MMPLELNVLVLTPDNRSLLDYHGLDRFFKGPLPQSLIFKHMVLFSVLLSAWFRSIMMERLSYLEFHQSVWQLLPDSDRTKLCGL